MRHKQDITASSRVWKEWVASETTVNNGAAFDGQGTERLSGLKKLQDPSKFDKMRFNETSAS